MRKRQEGGVQRGMWRKNRRVDVRQKQTWRGGGDGGESDGLGLCEEVGEGT